MQAKPLKKKNPKPRRDTVPVPRPVAAAKVRKNPKPHSQVSNLAALAGGALGGYFGNPAFGASIGRGASKLLGFGDYEIQSNSLMPGLDSSSSPPVPLFGKNGRRAVRVQEREYLGDIFSGALVNGSSVFNVTSYPINPAQFSTFPWLNVLAANFEQWEPLGMVFEFRSNSSSYNGTSQALGSVIIGTDYDPIAPLATTKVTLENMDYSDSCKASDNMMHGIECAPLERGDRLLLCRAGPVPSTTDNLRFYDLGNLQVATQGCSTAGVNLGELWVTYDIAFYKKQLTPGLSGNTINTYFRSTATPTTSTILGSAANAQCWGNMAMGRAANVYTFPASITSGTYLINIEVSGSMSVALTVTATTNCTLYSAQPDLGSYFLAQTTGFTPLPTSVSSTANAVNLCIICSISAASAVFTLSGTITSATWSAMSIIQMPVAKPLALTSV